MLPGRHEHDRLACLAQGAVLRVTDDADDLEEARLGPAFPVPPLDLRVPTAARATRSPTAGLTREQRRKALAGARGGDPESTDDTDED